MNPRYDPNQAASAREQGVLERRGEPPRRTRGRVLALLILVAVVALTAGILYPDVTLFAGIVVAAAVILWLYPWVRYRVHNHRDRAA